MEDDLELYFPIPVKELVPGKKLDFAVSCYLKLNSKIVVMRNIGGSFSAGSLSELRESGVFFLYVLKDQKHLYQKYLTSDITAILNDQSISSSERIKKSSEISQKTLTKILDISNAEEASAALESINNFAQGVIQQCTSTQFSKNFMNLQKFMKEGSDLTVHSLNVSSLGIVFALALEKVELPFIEALAQAGLIHNLAMAELPAELINLYLNSPEEFAHELKTWPKDHPYFAHPQKIISDIDNKGLKISTVVKEIVLQHHEGFDGKGFPSGVKGIAIHFGAKLLHICDEYESRFRSYAATNRIDDLKCILQNLEKQQRHSARLDPRLLKALVNIIELSDTNGSPQFA